MQISTLFIDLDGTLYPNNLGMWQAISDRMNGYLIRTFNIPADQVATVRENYFHEYGTTLRGLQHHYEVNTEEYLAYVHDVPLEQFLKPDTELDEMFSQLPQTKIIFTNADRNHASRVLTTLGLRQHFSEIVDVLALDFQSKPQPSAFEKALEISGVTPAESLFADDIPKNLMPAKQMGFTTVLVGQDSTPDPAADFSLTRLHDLTQAIPALLNGATLK